MRSNFSGRSQELYAASPNSDRNRAQTLCHWPRYSWSINPPFCNPSSAYKYPVNKCPARNLPVQVMLLRDSLESAPVQVRQQECADKNCGGWRLSRSSHCGLNSGGTLRLPEHYFHPVSRLAARPTIRSIRQLCRPRFTDNVLTTMSLRQHTPRFDHGNFVCASPFSQALCARTSRGPVFVYGWNECFKKSNKTEKVF